jgi:orotate phosphoribosyltransferase
LSHDYIDGKFAVSAGPQLRLVSNAAVDLAQNCSIDFDAVGGLTMGADALAHGIAMVAGCVWFSVRKEPKSHGREQWIEGGRLSPAARVLLVDDVVTTGASIMTAYERVIATGARVVGVITLMDRGDSGTPRFERLGVPYAALVTYKDLNIEPVDGPPVVAATR